MTARGPARRLLQLLLLALLAAVQAGCVVWKAALRQRPRRCASFYSLDLTHCSPALAAPPPPGRVQAQLLRGPPSLQDRGRGHHQARIPQTGSQVAPGTHFPPQHAHPHPCVLTRRLLVDALWLRRTRTRGTRRQTPGLRRSTTVCSLPASSSLFVGHHLTRRSQLRPAAQPTRSCLTPPSGGCMTCTERRG